MKKLLFAVCLILVTASLSFGQRMERRRAFVDGPVDAAFKAPKLVISNTTKNLEARTLNMSIYHGFGPLTSGAGQFWGLDGSANIRLGLDYGVTNRLSVGLGRTKNEKVVDLRGKYTLLRQLKSDKVPVTIAISTDMGITTQKNGYEFVERLSFAHMLLISRKFSPNLSLQLFPSYAHLNRVRNGPNDFFSVGFGGRQKLTNRTSFSFEYIPVFSQHDDIRHTISGGFSIETGGHVFQVFVTTTDWFTQQFIMRESAREINFERQSRDPENIFDTANLSRAFRIGFNVNRLFWLKRKNPAVPDI